MLLSTIASGQAEDTKTTLKNTKKLLDYVATYPNATTSFYASDMIMNINSDASYLYSKGARSCASRYFFMGYISKDDGPIFLNGAFSSLCAILKFVAL